MQNKMAHALLNLRYKKLTPDAYIFITLLVVFTTLVVIYQIHFSNTNQQFVYLADSFLHGKTYFLEVPGNDVDLINIGSRLYWHLGLFPTILIMPFEWIFNAVFHVKFSQAVPSIVLTYGSLFIAYLLARKHRLTKIDSAYISFALIFSSVYHLSAFSSWSWYFVQTICFFLVLLAIYEGKTKNRPLVIGILFAIVFLTRTTAALGSIYFLLLILLDTKADFKHKLIGGIKLFLPLTVAFIIFCLYNQARFNNLFESGYKLTNIGMNRESDRYVLTHYGLFNIRNIPNNFYWYFLKGLQPVTADPQNPSGEGNTLKYPFFKIGFPGTSFFIVSPMFLLLIKANWKDKKNIVAGSTSLGILSVLLMYYWPGWNQVGPRYMIDLLPFMYILLISVFEKIRLDTKLKFLIIMSAVVNFYLLVSAF